MAQALTPDQAHDMRLRLLIDRDIRPDILIPSGRYFDFLNPETNVYTVEDVAHNLAHICRFTGSVRKFYSVAQHAVIVSYLVPPHLAWQALHHDDAEFVLGDVSGPLKALLPGYKAIEALVESVMFPRLGFNSLDPLVKLADRMALATEKRDLMPKARPDSQVWVADAVTGTKRLQTLDPADVWSDTKDVRPMARSIAPVSSEEAEAMYLERHYELLQLQA